MAVRKVRKSVKAGKRNAKRSVKRAGRKFRIVFSSEHIYSNTKAAIDLCSKRRFGELKNGRVVYSVYEVLYLLEGGKVEVLSRGKKISFDKLMREILGGDKKAKVKYLVFRDMRAKGYIVKTALKFGAEFRVYEKGVKPGEAHARWILYPVSENSELTWHDFSAKNRVAHSTKKNLLIAIVDAEEDVSYYEVGWVKP